MAGNHDFVLAKFVIVNVDWVMLRQKLLTLRHRWDLYQEQMALAE